MGCANMLINATGILQRDVRAQFGEDWRKGASDSVATHVPVPGAAASRFCCFGMPDLTGQMRDDLFELFVQPVISLGGQKSVGQSGQPALYAGFVGRNRR